MSNQPSPLKLLSLDGGGVRGLASLIIIKYLMKRVNPDNPPKPCEYFDLIGGTSTGGIIAIMLGRLQMDVQFCIDKYCELSAAIFEPRRSHLSLLRRSVDKWDLKGKYRSEALEKLIRDVVEERLGDSQAKMFDPESSCKVFVCTFTKSLNTPVLIRSYKTVDDVDTQALLDCKIWEAARATSAAATFFDPITIGRQTFVDGATGNNNPIRQVLDEAKLIWPGAVSLGRIQCIVSVGTGVPSLEDFGDNLKELVATLKRIATDTEEIERRFYRDHKDLGLGNKYFRFNVDRGLSDVALGAFEHIDTIETAAENYLRNDRVKESVEMLVSSKASMFCVVSREEKERYLKWLYPVDTLRLFNDARSRKKVESEWFLREPLESWMQETCSALWLVGKPGAGKTVLSASVIDLLQKKPDFKVLYFFFSFGDNNTQSVVHFKQSLLSQLVRRTVHEVKDHHGSWRVPIAFQRLFNDYQPSRDPPIERVEEAFWELLDESPETFIVVDALDECLDPESRQSVLRFLKQFQTYSHGRNHVMVTSRWLDDIDRAMQSAKVVRIKSGHVDQVIESYLDLWLTSSAPDWWEKDLKMHVTQKILKRAKGVFRWAALQLLNLKRCARALDVEKALEELPRDLEQTYKDMFDRIYHNHYQPVVEIAEIAVFRNTRDLEHETTLFNPRERFPNIHNIRSILSGLITISGVDDGSTSIGGDDGKVTFSHFTVLEYLKGPGTALHAFHVDKTEAHRFIMESSLSYLRYYENVCSLEASSENHPYSASDTTISGASSSNSLDLGIDLIAQSSIQFYTNDPDDYTRYKPFPLLFYTMKHWWKHCLAFRRSGGKQEEIKRMLITGHMGPIFQLSIETGLTESADNQIDDVSQLQSLCELHISSFEMSKAPRNFKFDWDAAYPLHEAVKTEDWHIVKIVLDAGTAIDREDGSFRARQSDCDYIDTMTAMRQLISGPMTDINDENGMRHLRHLASPLENIDALSALYCSKAQIKNLGWTPLHWAIEGEDRSIAIKLIEHGANILCASYLGLTPLVLAIMTGQENVVEAMIKQNNESCIAWRDVHWGDRSAFHWGAIHWAAIHWAAFYSNEAIVTMLLDAGAQISEKDDTALSLMSLVAIGASAYMKAIIDIGYPVWPRMRTINLIEKVCGGAASVIILLISHEAVMRRCNDQPLHFATRYGQLEQLLENSVELTIENKDDWSLLARIVRRGFRPVVKALVPRRAEVDTVNEGNASLATANQHREIMELLLRMGADTSLRETREEKTASENARDAKYRELERLILEMEIMGWE
ncbi:hypothetical protein F5B19DRAFT_490645 [Rostrohypoxylon terebratum]|nr:hypothetical protein F5B19DRAFT_490645 [Rostrohypoxylon terebratum]